MRCLCSGFGGVHRSVLLGLEDFLHLRTGKLFEELLHSDVLIGPCVELLQFGFPLGLEVQIGAKIRLSLPREARLKVFLFFLLVDSIGTSKDIGPVERLTQGRVIEPVSFRCSNHVFAADLLVLRVLLDIGEEVRPVRFSYDCHQQREVIPDMRNLLVHVPFKVESLVCLELLRVVRIIGLGFPFPRVFRCRRTETDLVDQRPELHQRGFGEVVHHSRKATRMPSGVLLIG